MASNIWDWWCINFNYFKPFRSKTALYYIVSTILADVLEYSTAWYLETFKGMKWWDYSGYFLNLHGKICLEGLIVFGLGGYVLHCSIT